jgi:DNA-cytosine methyltransferase
MNILSLFDGMSCGQIALERVGIKYDNYFASEVDKYAIQITQKNYPNTIQLGDIIKWADWHLPNIDLLIGGSPCQGFSVAGQGLNFNDPRSELFFRYVDCLKRFKPKWFLLENVKMKKEWRNIISEHLRVEPIEINSALVSAQNRVRLYWTNIPNIIQPEDKGILLKDIIENGTTDKDKSYCIDANYFKGGSLKMYSEKKRRQIDNLPHKSVHQSERQLCIQVGEAEDINGYDIVKRVYSPEGKSPALTSMQGGHRQPKIVANIYSSGGQNGNVYDVEGKSPTLSAGIGVVGRGIGSSNAPKVSDNGLSWRKLTPLECERLQTVPDGYTEGVSNTQRYKMLGNGWTVDVIAHIFSFIK